MTPLAAVGGLLDHAFADPQPDAFGVSLATVVVHHDAVVLERYGAAVSDDTTLISWSTAKSITQAAAGILVRQGRLDPHARASVREWADPADPRHAITVDQLLRMSSGLAWVEDYVDDAVSDVIAMLFGEGQADTAHFAASSPLACPPGEVWTYSSGTTNIVARLLGDIVGGEAAMAGFLQAELFDAIGMHSATARFDDAGTFVGSSFVYATARDFARFGELYLRDGVWNGRRLLPPGWVDYARTPTPTCETGEYGAHWWLRPNGVFCAQGYEGQYIYVVPAADAVIVRLGKTPAEKRPAVEAWLDEIVDILTEL
jgi:CubicO group peptidase (beta-lactamase class C family)